MRIALTMAAAVALLMQVAVTLPAQAQIICDGPCVIVGGLGGGGGGGDATDPKNYKAGEPFNPFGDGGKLRDQTGDDGPGADPKLPGYVAGLPLCKTELGDLRKVRAGAINEVDHGVTVVAICSRKNLMDQQDGIPSIRSAIEANAAMHKALRDAGSYSANDVVAVVLDGEGAKLYVHRNRDSVGSLTSGGGGTDGFLRSQK